MPLGELDFAGGYFGDGGGVKLVLLGEDAELEGLGCIACEDGDAGLGEDGAFVVDFVDEMHGGPGFGFAGGDDGFVHVHAEHAFAAEFWEERGVDIEDAVAVADEKFGTDLFHVAGEDDEVDVGGLQGFEYGGVEVSWVGV